MFWVAASHSQAAVNAYSFHCLITHSLLVLLCPGLQLLAHLLMLMRHHIVSNQAIMMLPGPGIQKLLSGCVDCIAIHFYTAFAYAAA